MPSIGHNASRPLGHADARSTARSSVRTRSAPGVPLFVNAPKAAEVSVHKGLLALAARPAYGVTLALAGTIAHSWNVRGVRYLPLFGLDAETTYRLLSCHFPGIGRMIGVSWDELVLPEVFDEAGALTDLVEMLIQHRTVVDEDSTWLAHAVTTSCLGDAELWRDMNLPATNVLDDLLHDFFTILFARNRSGTPWKAFFQQELIERAERRLRRMNACGALPDYGRCFGLAAQAS